MTTTPDMEPKWLMPILGATSVALGILISLVEPARMMATGVVLQAFGTFLTAWGAWKTWLQFSGEEGLLVRLSLKLEEVASIARSWVTREPRAGSGSASVHATFSVSASGSSTAIGSLSTNPTLEGQVEQLRATVERLEGETGKMRRELSSLQSEHASHVEETRGAIESLSDDIDDAVKKSHMGNVATAATGLLVTQAGTIFVVFAIF